MASQRTQGGKACEEPRAGGELARSVAERLQAEINAGDLRPGAHLGRAADLMRRLRVSRPTLRAAIRQLEANALVRTRTGVGGGLFVLGDAGPGTLGLARHLSLLGLSYRLFFQIHMPFYEAVAVLAAGRARPADRRRIAVRRLEMRRATYSHAQYSVARAELHKMIARAADNPALEAIGAALTRAYREILRGEMRLGHTELDKVRQVKAAEDAVLAALVRGDVAETRRRARAASAVEMAVADDTIQRGMLPERVIPQTLYAIPDEMRTAKLAELTARALRRTIHLENARPGTWLGSAPDLSNRLGVSYDICREALGLLEPHGLISLRRGRKGGVYVGAPNAKKVLPALRDEILRGGAGGGQLLEAARLLRDLKGGVVGLPEFPGEADSAHKLLDELAVMLEEMAA